MMNPSSILINLSLLVYKIAGFSYYDCSDTNSLCKNTNIKCSPNDDCFIQCNDFEICQDSIIHCPLNGNCDIECRGDKSCQNLILNATYSQSGNINILCQDSENECENLQIYGSIYEGDLNLKCNGNFQSCLSTKIKCPTNGNCNIKCSTSESCKNSSISGPINGDLSIDCVGSKSCLKSTFNAINSDELDINGCTESQSCLDLKIYCPPISNTSDPTCFVEGNDNLGSTPYADDGMIIYAINGWQDIDIAYSGSFGMRHHGMMYCGSSYQSQCEFAESEWTCFNSSALCNRILNTDSPTTTRKDIDDASTTYYKGYLPPPKNNFKHGSLGMILVGGGLIALAFGCVVCGTIRKGLERAKRKLSDMGFKSPFNRGPQQGHHLSQNSHFEQSMAESSYSHSIHRQNSGYMTRADSTRTANIHRPDSHSVARTANINRPDSYMSNHNGGNNNNHSNVNHNNHNNVNYNNYGQDQLGAMGHHGHIGHDIHPKNTGSRGATHSSAHSRAQSAHVSHHSNNNSHNIQRHHSHHHDGSAVHSSGGSGHNGRSSANHSTVHSTANSTAHSYYTKRGKHDTEMVPIR